MTITLSVTSPGSVILFYISPSSYIRLQLIDAMYDSVRHQPYISFSGATSNSNPKPQGIRTTSRETGSGFLFLTSAWGPSYYGLVLSLSWSMNSFQLVQLWPCSMNNIDKSPGESPSPCFLCALIAGQLLSDVFIHPPTAPPFLHDCPLPLAP